MGTASVVDVCSGAAELADCALRLIVDIVPKIGHSLTADNLSEVNSEDSLVMVWCTLLSSVS